MESLQNTKLEAPDSLYYIPEFITKEEESYLLKHVYDAPKPKWTQLSNRRLQNWGGLPHPKGMVPEDLPEWLKVYIKKISSMGVFGDKEANHVLVNEYLPGQGIMPHEDGPLFFPTVSTISLGSHTVLDFYSPLQESMNGATNDSEPRSLILVKDDMYKVNLHGIAERTEDLITDKVVNLCKCDGVKIGQTLTRTTRVSLTIRVMPKVLKAKLFLGRKR